MFWFEELFYCLIPIEKFYLRLAMIVLWISNMFTLSKIHCILNIWELAFAMNVTHGLWPASCAHCMLRIALKKVSDANRMSGIFESDAHVLEP